MLLRNHIPVAKNRLSLLKATLLLLMISLLACDRSQTPKPAGYMRIDTPPKAYMVYDDQPFYRFEIPVYSRVERDSLRRMEPGWINVAVPGLNGKIHLSYKPISDNLATYITDCRRLAYKHTVKADGIEETPFVHRQQNRFGMIYDLSGNVASGVQFFVTDSTTHFLRGSLYFNCPPNQDSLKPLVDFLREDIIHLIETTEWKY
ncbi:MAG: gliding motility lipoprotein GldD [Bacteroidota bacterium]